MTEGSDQRLGYEPDMAGTSARTEAETDIESLRLRGGMFVEAVARTRMPMTVTDFRLPGNPIVFANDAFIRLSGYSMNEVLGQKPHFLNGPDTDPQDAAQFREALRRGEDIVVESFQYRKDGSRFFAAVFCSPVLDADGRVLQHFLSYLDITRRVEAEQELRDHAADLERTVENRMLALREGEEHLSMLVAELQHRVRNTLGVVRSIARRTAQNSATVEEMSAHFEGRLDAFARVQALVTRRPGAGVDLATLIEDELVAHAAREGEAILVKGPEVAFAARPAETLSLAIHELATNAVKYGALSVEGGRLAIRWTLVDGHFELVWQESRVPGPLTGPKREGFGMELLGRVVPYELSAESRLDFRPDGLVFTLVMPVEGNIRIG